MLFFVFWVSPFLSFCAARGRGSSLLLLAPHALSSFLSDLLLR